MAQTRSCSQRTFSEGTMFMIRTRGFFLLNLKSGLPSKLWPPSIGHDILRLRLVTVAQSCPILCDPIHSPWDSPGQNIGVGSHSLLQGIFRTKGLNPGLLHCRRILYQLSHKGSLHLRNISNSILKRNNFQKDFLKKLQSLLWLSNIWYVGIFIYLLMI